MNKKSKSKFWIIALVLLIASMSPILIDQQKMIFAKNKEMSIVKDKIESEKKLREQLKAQKKILNSDVYTEKIAREKFGWIKAGEKVFVDVNK
jgi:cell division protein FtsB